MAKLGRNDPCHCGSGKKYKKCCMAKDNLAAQAAIAAAAAERQKAAAEAEPEDEASKKTAEPGHPSTTRKGTGKSTFWNGGASGGGNAASTGVRRASGRGR